MEEEEVDGGWNISGSLPATAFANRPIAASPSCSPTISPAELPHGGVPKEAPTAVPKAPPKAPPIMPPACVALADSRDPVVVPEEEEE